MHEGSITGGQFIGFDRLLMVLDLESKFCATSQDMKTD